MAYALVKGNDNELIKSDSSETFLLILFAPLPVLDCSDHFTLSWARTAGIWCFPGHLVVVFSYLISVIFPMSW